MFRGTNRLYDEYLFPWILFTHGNEVMLIKILKYSRTPFIQTCIITHNFDNIDKYLI